MSSVESMINILQDEVTLLQRLLYLSKLELETLKSSRYDDLPELVSQKNELVSQIDGHVARFDELLGQNANLLEKISPTERRLLENLQQEGTQVLELISAVDTENRLQLENKRSQIIQDSRQLRQEFRLTQAYGPLSLHNSRPSNRSV